MSVTPISGASPITPVLAAPAAPGGTGFGDVLNSAIQNVEGARSAGAQAVENFLSGESGELHSTILAAQRASLSFDLFLQVRNKVVSAYQEIMRMQV